MTERRNGTCRNCGEPITYQAPYGGREAWHRQTEGRVSHRTCSVPDWPEGNPWPVAQPAPDHPEASTATAREMIETALMTLWRIDEQDELNDRPRRLLDQYAHELAEKIRSHANRRERDEEATHGFIDHEAQLQREYAEELANLIDPKAQA